MHATQYVVSAGVSPVQGGPAIYCPGLHASLHPTHCLSSCVLPVQKPAMYSPAGGLVALNDRHLPLQGEQALSRVPEGSKLQRVLMY